MPKRFIYFLTTLILLISFSHKQTKEDLILLEYVINQNKDVKDSTLLKKNFEGLQKNSNSYISQNLDVIYNIYLGNIYSDLLDNVNPRSNHLYNQALKTSKDLNNNSLIAWVNTQVGFYYYNYSEYQKAFPFFMYASKILDSYPEEQLLQKGYVYKTNAYFFGNVGDVEKSKNYLKLALSNTHRSERDFGSILNALGTIYLDKNDYANAEHYYKLTKISAIKNQDKIRYAKALGDLALIYFHQKKYDLAIELLKEDIKISEEQKEYRNLMFANLRLGKIYIETNNLSASKEVILKAKEYASKKEYLKSFEYEINQALLDIAIKEKNVSDELDLRRKISENEAHLEKTDGQNVINQINWDIQKKNFDYKYEAEKAKAAKEQMLKNALIIIAVLLFIVIIFIYVLFKRKINIQNSEYENTVLQLENEKLKSENILSKTTKSLDDYKIYLTEKNRQIEFLNNEIDSIKGSNVFSQEKEKGKLNKLLHSHLMTEENWNNFKTVFIFEQKEFCEKLDKNLPNLTDSNLRIIFLQKLGLSNIEIAHILGITPDAVKKAKQRLKKKYENFDEVLAEN